MPQGPGWSWDVSPWATFLLKGLVKRVLLRQWKWSGKRDAEKEETDFSELKKSP